MSLENIVNGSTPKKSFLARHLNNPNRGLLGKIFDYGVAIGATICSYSLIGPLALVSAGIAVVGDYVDDWKKGKTTTSARIRDSSILSAIWSPIGNYIFNFMNSSINLATTYGKALRAFAQLVAVPLTVGLVGFTSDYVVRHKQFRGAYTKQIKPFFMKNYWDSFKYLSIPRMLITYTMPPSTHYPLDIGLRFLRRISKVGNRHITALDPYGTGSLDYAASPA